MPPPYTMVTIVPSGGTPFQLCDQRGAAFPTTGTGGLVFANGPTLVSPVLQSPVIQGSFPTPLTTQGDIYYYGPVGPDRLPRGNAGQVLQSTASGVQWGNAAAGTLVGITQGTGISVTPTDPTQPTVALTNTITAGGPTGAAATVPVITYNAQGRLTAVTTAAITAAAIGAQPSGTYVTGVTAGTGMTVTGTATVPVVNQANVITAGGPTGAANSVPVITYNAQGSLTAVTTATITPTAIGALSSITAGTGMTVTGSAPTQTVGLSNVIAAGGPVGSTTTVPVITYNAQGQLTVVSSATIAVPAGTLTGISAGTGVNVTGSAPTQTVAIANQITAGTVGSTIAIPVITYNAQGQITNTTVAPITAPPAVTSITAGTGLSGGTITTTGTIALANQITAGSTGSSGTTIPVITYNAQGQITGMSSVGVSSTAGGTITSISAGTGIIATPNPIIATGTIAVDTTVIARQTDLANYLPLSGGTLTGTLNGTTINGSTLIKAVSGTNGAIELTPGNTTNTGYVAFKQPTTNTRTGYIGNVDGNGIISYAAEGSGGYHNFTNTVGPSRFTMANNRIGCLSPDGASQIVSYCDNSSSRLYSVGATNNLSLGTNSTPQVEVTTGNIFRSITNGNVGLGDSSHYWNTLFAQGAVFGLTTAGGNMGNGTVNATAYYVNGVALSGGGLPTAGGTMTGAITMQSGMTATLPTGTNYNIYNDSSGNLTFRSNANQITMSQSGNIVAGGQVTANSYNVGTAGAIAWSSSSQFMALANGNFTMANAAGNSFNLLQFGGTTASFPALKRSTTTLQARLADDSAYAGLFAQTAAWPTTGNQLATVDYVANVAPVSIMLALSSASLIASTTAAIILWDVVEFNNTGGTQSNGLFTVPTGMGGTWDFEAAAQYGTLPAGSYGIIYIYVNGVQKYNAIGAVGSSTGGVSISGKMRLSAGDTVGLYLSVTSSGGSYYGTNNGARNTWLHLTRISP